MLFLNQIEVGMISVVRVLFGVVLVAISVNTNVGQEQKSSTSGPTYADPVVQHWEFGLEISATGNAFGVLATVPVPIDWPEQKVKIVGENKSDAVTRLFYKDVGDEVKQLVIKIDRLPAGETVRASVVMEIEKHMIGKPEGVDSLRFATRRESQRLVNYLRPSPYIESRHPRIRELADSIPIDETNSAWEQVRTIYEWIREHIKYEFDPTIRTCLEALDRKQGDCEELSSLFIAICRAKGIPARAVWIPDHTYPEFYLVDPQGEGHWYPCQVAGDYEFGSMSGTKPVLQKGDNFKISGHPKRLRYVQPTLTAEHVEAPPRMKWIMRQVEKERQAD